MNLLYFRTYFCQPRKKDHIWPKKPFSKKKSTYAFKNHLVRGLHSKLTCLSCLLKSFVTIFPEPKHKKA